MRLPGIRLLCLIAGLIASAPAAAIFKCDAGGKVSYSDMPCDGGKRLDINAAPVSGDSDAGRQAAREKEQLQALEHERHRRETAEQRELRKASRESAARHKKCEAHARRQRMANDDVRKSTGVANEQAKIKAQRVTADYEAACGRWYERELGLGR